MKKIPLAASLLALSSFAWGDVGVSVAGLQVVGKEYQEEGSKEELRAFNWSPGINVALLLKSDEKAIVGFNKEKSTLSRFGDDKGKDFLKVKRRFSDRPFSFGMEQESESRKALMTTLESDALPASGATSITVVGELVLSLASKSELKKSEKAAVKKGQKVVVGGETFTIKEAEKPEWGEGKLEITLESAVDLKSFRRVVFYGADGKELESERGMWSSMGMFGKKTYQTSYRFKVKPEELVMGLEVWTDLEVVKVPIDLKIGVGL